MPANRESSKLISKYGDKFVKAFESHKSDETEFSNFGELPPGIENGIAKLRKAYFDTYKKGDNQGEVYFYAEGTVIEPEYHNGIKVRGLPTKIMEPICDTPGRSRATVADHIAHVLNELRKLGMNTEDIEPHSLEQTAQILADAQPHFSFRTWRGDPTPQYPNPRTNHQWNGAVEYVEGDDDGVVEQPRATTTSSANGRTATPPAKPASPGKPTKGMTGRQKPKEDEDEEVKQPASMGPESFNEFGEEEDLDELAEKADSNDHDAGKRLEEIAIEIGISGKTVNRADSWAAVVEMIREQRQKNEDEEKSSEDEEKEEGENEEAEEFVPTEDGVCFYTPVDAKGRPGKVIECEVISVDKKKKVATIKRLDTNVVIKAVPWSMLK